MYWKMSWSEKSGSRSSVRIAAASHGSSATATRAGARPASVGRSMRRPRTNAKSPFSHAGPRRNVSRPRRKT